MLCTADLNSLPISLALDSSAGATKFVTFCGILLILTAASSTIFFNPVNAVSRLPIVDEAVFTTVVMLCVAISISGFAVATTSGVFGDKDSNSTNFMF